jgi:16S rRNA (cytosine967-C5)-methyltransferase
VNGILRSIADRKAAWLSLPDGEDAASVAIRTGMPLWVIRRYMERFGASGGESIAAAFQRPAPTALIFPSEGALAEARPVMASEGWDLIPDPVLPLTFTVNKGNPAFSDAFQRGLFYIMDPASQAPAALVPLQGGERVLDLCAAPGGKTIVLANRLTGGGWILATDVNRRRLKHLEENVKRMKLSNVRLAQLDVDEALPTRDAFEVVILDAPCSSMGTLRRNPEIRWQIREEDLAQRGPKQLAFLEQASRAVAPGGTLVYSVCSMEGEETLEVVHRFLETHREFKPLKPDPPSAWKPMIEEVGEGQFLLLPDRHAWDAFFVAMFRRDTARQA